MINFKTDNFLKNQEVNRNIESILKKQLFSNGYIFSGAPGIGKKEKAFEFIQEIFKQYSPSSNIEEKIINNNHPDFLIIEPTYFIKGKFINRSEVKSPNDTKEIIRIDQIRQIKIFLSQKSIKSSIKIVLIIDAHLLNEAASNCLLKTLEEPSNGIFILLTSRLNLLLETIISRCQLIRFKSYSKKQLEFFLSENLDNSLSDIDNKINLQDLIKSSNGSPGKLINSIETWKELPNEIKKSLESPLKDYLEILEITKLISEQMEPNQQIFLVNLIQIKWWQKTKNEKIIRKLESLKSHLKNLINPRLAWEVTLLKIALEEL